jgi:hypothetical protein
LNPNFSAFENEQVRLLTEILSAVTLRGDLMATLEEATAAILAAIEAAKAAMLSAAVDLQNGAAAQAVADTLTAAAADLTSAAGDLSASDPTP